MRVFINTFRWFERRRRDKNANGIRTSKTIGDTTHFYTLEGTKILREDYCGSTLIPLYDNSDEVCGIQFNGSPYFFQKNLQGDVIAITNASGVVTGKYEYDAWGKILSITDQNGIDISSNVFHIANINPFRYRSYYYDTEIGMYYLQSRYYDPEVGRFVNGDDANIVGTEEQIICENLFCYCKNETTNQIDSNGHFSLPFISTKIINPMYVDPRISKARDNYKHNKSLTAPHGYINGQRRFSNFKFGCFDLGYMGCEIIAIFNLLTFLRKSPSLADLIYTFELGLYDYGAFGSLGLNPFSLGSYFKSQGIKYKLFTKQNDFESAVKKNYSFIISFWNDKDDIPMSELHTVFGYYILDHYVIFNYEAQYETRYAVLSNHFKDVLKNGKFVTGYYFTGRQYKW